MHSVLSSPRLRLVAGLMVAGQLLTACATLAGSTAVPKRQNDICAIFAQNPSWKRATRKVEREFGAPIAVQMAIIWKESSFRHDARPPKKPRLFGLVKWGRISSAYGYSQALDGTWDWYLRDTGRNSWFAQRDDFDDAAHFVGWYMTKTKNINGVAMGDAVSQYLAYHEGHGGYRRGSYRSKKWLLNAARRVGNMASVYNRQLRSCG
ncbi:MAG: hypothetical protein AAF909_03770 [Pseudomonadota bacterium]